MKNRTVRAVAFAAILLALAWPAHAAMNAYLRIEGKKGEIKGEGVAKWQGWVPVESAQIKPESNRDAASGLPTGKRMHEPLVIMKHVDSSSPMLMKASAGGEHFDSVDVVYVHGDEVIKRLHLEDVVISGIRKSGEMEEVQFTFQKIEYRDKDGKTMGMDDWHATK